MKKITLQINIRAKCNQRFNRVPINSTQNNHYALKTQAKPKTGLLPGLTQRNKQAWTRSLDSQGLCGKPDFTTHRHICTQICIALPLFLTSMQCFPVVVSWLIHSSQYIINFPVQELMGKLSSPNTQVLGLIHTRQRVENLTHSSWLNHFRVSGAAPNSEFPTPQPECQSNLIVGLHANCLK